MNEFSGTKVQCFPSVGLATARSKKSSQIEGQVEFIKQDLSFLQDRITSLASRLSPILKNECEKIETPTVPQDTLTPLGETLRSISDSIKYQAISIKSLMDRLEL